jgi:hypothetical protein
MHCDECVKSNMRKLAVWENIIHDAEEDTHHHGMQQSKKDCTTPLFDKHNANRAFMPRVCVAVWK